MILFHFPLRKKISFHGKQFSVLLSSGWWLIEDFSDFSGALSPWNTLLGSGTHACFLFLNHTHTPTHPHIHTHTHYFNRNSLKVVWNFSWLIVVNQSLDPPHSSTHLRCVHVMAHLFAALLVYLVSKLQDVYQLDRDGMVLTMLCRELWMSCGWVCSHENALSFLSLELLHKEKPGKSNVLQHYRNILLSLSPGPWCLMTEWWPRYIMYEAWNRQSSKKKKKGFRPSMHAHIKCTDIYSLTVRLLMPNINIFDSAALLLLFQAFLRTCVLLKDFQYGDRLVLFCCETSKGFTWNDWEMAASPNKGNVT